MVLGFNRDGGSCLCILPLKSSKTFHRKHYIETLSNTSCDLYCNNTYEGSKTEQKFPCGSSKDPKIWAIYDLNGTCPINFIYIKEVKKCMHTYKYSWNSCTPPSTTFIYDGNITWDQLLKMINKLQLEKSSVAIEFDKSVVIDPSWKCSNSTSTSSLSSVRWRSNFSRSRSSLNILDLTARYILKNGCLLKKSYLLYSHRYSHRLCATDPINKYSITNNENNDKTYISVSNPRIKYCPTNWLDLNGRCYRISEERKTITEARMACINTSTSELDTFSKPRIWLIDSSGNIIGGNQLSNSPKGEIVGYVSEWQARLGFFLLDTDPDHGMGIFNCSLQRIMFCLIDYDDTDTTTSLTNVFYDNALLSSNITDNFSSNHGSINEFQAINASANGTVDIKDKSCVVVTRLITEEEERPMLQSTNTNDCSKRRHVLCETNTLVVPKFRYNCFSKPKVLDLPALISNILTHELCLSTCQELQTKIAILHINKCYCLNGATPTTLNITTDFATFRKENCGKPCLGMYNKYGYEYRQFQITQWNIIQVIYQICLICLVS